MGALLGLLASYWLNSFIQFQYLTPILVLLLSGITARIMAKTRHPGLISGIILSIILILGILAL